MKRVDFRLTGRVEGWRPVVSERALAVAALFGVEVGAGTGGVLFEDVPVRVGAGEVILVTGPSGAGKSTLLRALVEAMGREGMGVVRLEEIELAGDRALVDCFAGGLEEGLGALARAGLSEARLLLQTPAQLSEGQRFRYRLARFFAGEGEVLVADEFAATLDRVTARVVAYQLGKFVRNSELRMVNGECKGKAVIVATTHEDLAEDLRPTQRIYVDFQGRIERDDLTQSCTECTEDAQR